MDDNDRFGPVVAEIARRFGPVIDLDQSPGVMIEVLRTFGPRFSDSADDDGGGGGGGGGGPGPTVSTIAVGITPPDAGEEVQLADVLRAVLRVQRELSDLGERVDRLSPSG